MDPSYRVYFYPPESVCFSVVLLGLCVCVCVNLCAYKEWVNVSFCYFMMYLYACSEHPSLLIQNHTSYDLLCNPLRQSHCSLSPCSGGMVKSVCCYETLGDNTLTTGTNLENGINAHHRVFIEKSTSRHHMQTVWRDAC